MSDLDKVIEYAKELHKNQKRKYTGEPYFVHLEAVAKKVEIYSDYMNKSRGRFNECWKRIMLYSAYLHDSLEDTDVTHEELRVWLHSNIDKDIADRVLETVVELTDVYTKENFPELNRQQRKKLEAERMSCASEFTKTVKLFDILDNTESIVAHDEKFAKVYLKEKEYLLKCINSFDLQLRVSNSIKEHEASGAE